eukprot:2444551-Amphidinium_carterae.1
MQNTRAAHAPLHRLCRSCLDVCAVHAAVLHDDSRAVSDAESREGQDEEPDATRVKKLGIWRRIW